MSQLLAGVASREITPDPDDHIPLVGYGDPGERLATGVHDPLSLSALVVSDGETTVGIVSADVIRITRELAEGVRGRLHDRGIPIDEVVLAATHTHAGPHYPSTPSPYSLDADLTHVAESIERAAAGALIEASEGLSEATLRVGRAENDVSAENRRARGGVNSGVRIPTGGIDPAVTVLAFETSSSTAVLFNYACHPVCTVPSETLVSADWPGYVYDRLREEHGEVTPMFVNGACGDVNPRDRYAADRSGEEVYAYMEAVGNEIADAVSTALSSALDSSPVAATPIEADRRELDLPLKSVPDREVLQRRIEELREEVERLETEDEPGFDERHYDRLGKPASLRRGDLMYARTLRRIVEWDRSHLSASMTYLGFGDVGVLTVPGEAFVRHGLDFKERAAGPLVVAGYVDGHVGYIPTADELGNAGYENNVSRIAPEAIRAIRETGFDLVP